MESQEMDSRDPVVCFSFLVGQLLERLDPGGKYCDNLLMVPYVAPVVGLRATSRYLR